MRNISVALDMGNSGGKVLAACMEGGKLDILDERVIENRFVEINGHLYWDVFALFAALKRAMAEFSHLGRVVSVGIDATSGCYGFVRQNGRLSSQVGSGRDSRYENWEQAVTANVPLRTLYDETGVFPMQGNNICKLACDVANGDLAPDSTDMFLPLSGLMGYFLTGEMALERSMAGAAVLMDRDFADWNRPLLQKLGIPTTILPQIKEPGTIGEKLLPSVARETNCPDCRFVRTVEFDSSAALISAPSFNKNKIYLSMGTTINPGVELDRPLLSDEAYLYRYKNVPVWEGSYMLLSDVPGFFTLSECLKSWNAQGEKIGHGDLVRMADECKTDAFINFFDPRFGVSCDDMPARVQAFCRETEQVVPESIGQIARVLYESYAVTIAWSIDRLCRITQRDDYEDVTAISGGSRNALLCKMIADASGRVVRAGNPTATALGNLLAQFYALGQIDSLDQMRAVAADICPMTRYEPTHSPHLARGLAYIQQKGFVRT